MTKTQINFAATAENTCPKCLAQPGAPCVFTADDLTRAHIGGYHDERIRLHLVESNDGVDDEQQRREFQKWLDDKRIARMNRPRTPPPPPEAEVCPVTIVAAAKTDGRLNALIQAMLAAQVVPYKITHMHDERWISDFRSTRCNRYEFLNRVYSELVPPGLPYAVEVNVNIQVGSLLTCIEQWGKDVRRPESR